MSNNNYCQKKNIMQQVFISIWMDEKITGIVSYIRYSFIIFKFFLNINTINDIFFISTESVHIVQINWIAYLFHNWIIMQFLCMCLYHRISKSVPRLRVLKIGFVVHKLNDVYHQIVIFCLKNLYDNTFFKRNIFFNWKFFRALWWIRRLSKWRRWNWLWTWLYAWCFHTRK